MCIRDSTATVTFENAPYGNLRVDKIDADSGASLAGDVYKRQILYDTVFGKATKIF